MNIKLITRKKVVEKVIGTNTHNEFKAQILFSIQNFNLSTEQLARINEIINE